MTYKQLAKDFRKAYVDERGVICAIAPDFFVAAYEYINGQNGEDFVDEKALKKEILKLGDFEKCYGDLQEMFDREREERRITEMLNAAVSISVSVTRKDSDIIIVLKNEKDKKITALYFWKYPHVKQFFADIDDYASDVIKSVKFYFGDNLSKVNNFKETEAEIAEMVRKG